MGELQLEHLVAATLAAPPGPARDAAWERLWSALEPALWELVTRPRFAAHLAHSEDNRRRIVAAVRAQLVADRYDHLHLFVDARKVNPRLGFIRWLRTFAKRIGMSYATYEAQAPLGSVRRRSARSL